MLFDMRTYHCRPGTAGQHLELYGRHGFAVQSRHMGAPLVYALTESGPQNSYTHVWAYKNAADREARRAGMMADPEWRAYRDMITQVDFMMHQDNRLLNATSFYDARSAAQTLLTFARP
ncbi:MAG: hypothetical protein JWP99_1675 [Devosia sp.]|nr:hypothetical protein [Devosia sp.]